MENPTKETLKEWTKDPKNWTWGIFYYNPEDKRILPPKKQEWMGWTVNFANTKSVLVFLGSILFFIAVVLMITKNRY